MNSQIYKLSIANSVISSDNSQVNSMRSDSLLHALQARHEQKQNIEKLVDSIGQLWEESEYDLYDVG